MGYFSKVAMLAHCPDIQSLPCKIVRPSDNTELSGVLALCSFTLPDKPAEFFPSDAVLRLIYWSFFGVCGGLEDVIFLTGVYSYLSESDLLWVKRQIFVSLRVIPDDIARFDEVFGSVDFSPEGVS